jgi:hypothetical protein
MVLDTKERTKIEEEVSEGGGDQEESGKKPSKARKGEVIYEAYCVGITPLLMHRMPEEMIQRVLIDGERPVKETDLEPRERCEKNGYFYRDPNDTENGAFGIPTDHLLSAMKAGGRDVKIGKSKVSTATSTKLHSFLTVLEDFLPFGADEQDWVPDVRRGNMSSGSSKVAVGITRPKFLKWSFKVRLRVSLGDGVSESTIKQILEYAGRRAGVCSFRPSCGGRFGQFRIEDWKEVQE